MSCVAEAKATIQKKKRVIVKKRGRCVVKAIPIRAKPIRICTGQFRIKGGDGPSPVGLKLLVDIPEKSP